MEKRAMVSAEKRRGQAIKRIYLEKQLTLPPYDGGMSTISGIALHGLHESTLRLNRAAAALAEAPVTGADTTRPLIEAKQSLHTYRANAAVLQLDQERQDYLLDILA